MTLPIDPIKREAYIKKMSESKKGRPAWNKGKTASKESREKMSKSHIGIQAGENHPFYGISRSDEVKMKISASLKGKPVWNKGKSMPESMKQKMRERVISEETRKKMSDAKKGKPSLMKGKHLTESAKQKLREANLGKKQSTETIEKRVSKTRGENHWNYGGKFTPETIEKMRASKVGMYTLEKNPAWRGGVSYEPYCIKFNDEFKERVRAFFNYQCLECLVPQNGRKLDVHHVHYQKSSCCSDQPAIFVPLCHDCHSSTRQNRKYWIQHFTEIIKQYYGGKCYFTKEEMQAIQSYA